MTSKYSIAKDVIAELTNLAGAANLEADDVCEATLVMLVQALKEARGPANVRSVLQYEIDSLGSGGVYEIARGGGHS